MAFINRQLGNHGPRQGRNRLDDACERTGCTLEGHADGSY
jgi:hypothetical protein